MQCWRNQIQIIFRISHLVCLFLEIGCGRKSPGHKSMLAPTLPQLCHVAMNSNQWQIHATIGETINETIRMDGAHHQWINGIVTGMGQQHWWRYFFFGHAAKTRAGSDMRVAMGDFMVWAQKLDLSVHQNTNGKLTSRAFDWCDNKTSFHPVWYSSLSQKL